MGKNSFVLYTDYLAQIEMLSMEQRGMLLTAIMLYQAGEEIPDVDPVTAMAFSFIKTNMDRDNDRYEKIVEARREAGKTGGRPKKEAEKQTKAKKPDNDNDIENDSENDSENVIEKKSIGRFTPPSVDEVHEYAYGSGYSIDADKFIDFYESKGWMVGKNKMKDWRAAVRNWSRSDRQRQGGATKGNKFNFKGRDIDYDELERQLLQG